MEQVNLLETKTETVNVESNEFIFNILPNNSFWITKKELFKMLKGLENLTKNKRHYSHIYSKNNFNETNNYQYLINDQFQTKLFFDTWSEEMLSKKEIKIYKNMNVDHSLPLLRNPRTFLRINKNVIIRGKVDFYLSSTLLLKFLKYSKSNWFIIQGNGDEMTIYDDNMEEFHINSEKWHFDMNDDWKLNEFIKNNQVNFSYNHSTWSSLNIEIKYDLLKNIKNLLENGLNPNYNYFRNDKRRGMLWGYFTPPYPKYYLFHLSEDLNVYTTTIENCSYHLKVKGLNLTNFVYNHFAVHHSILSYISDLNIKTNPDINIGIDDKWIKFGICNHEDEIIIYIENPTYLNWSKISIFKNLYDRFNPINVANNWNENYKYRYHFNDPISSKYKIYCPYDPFEYCDYFSNNKLDRNNYLFYSVNNKKAWFGFYGDIDEIVRNNYEKRMYDLIRSFNDDDDKEFDNLGIEFDKLNPINQFDFNNMMNKINELPANYIDENGEQYKEIIFKDRYIIYHNESNIIKDYETEFNIYLESEYIRY